MTMKEIFVIGYPDEIGKYITQMLQERGYDVQLNESQEFQPPCTTILADLSKNAFDMVIVSFWGYHWILPEIRKHFPKIKIMFLNSYDGLPQQQGVDAIVRVPYDEKDLLSRIETLLFV